MGQVLIGFSRPKRFKVGSAVIRAWMGGTPYSHVYLRVHSNYTDETLVYQASHGLVNCMHYDAFLKHNHVVKEFERPISKENLRNCIKAAQRLLGRPYGYLGLLTLAASRVLPLPGDGYRTLHCSEFIGALFPELAAQVPDDLLEPVHLYRELQGAL